jgi:DNA-binding CsgD family transcriptional regulator
MSVMASPVTTSRTSRLPHRPAPNGSGFRTARHLRDLSSTLVKHWSTLDDESRHAMIHEILHAAEEIQVATPQVRAPVLVAVPHDAFSYLTPRELQILTALAEGASTDGMADRFGISPMTIRSYVKSILSKLGVHSRLAAVTMFLNRDPR